MGLRIECYWNPELLTFSTNETSDQGWGWEVIFYSITAKIGTSEPSQYWLGALRAIFNLNHRSSWFFHNSTMWVRVKLQIWIESWKMLTFWAFRSCDLEDQGWYWTIFLDLFDISARQVRWHIWLKIWWIRQFEPFDLFTWGEGAHLPKFRKLICRPRDLFGEVPPW